MAGLFGMFNYAKPGKGVDKNASNKHRFILFFELYFRKFTKMICMNIVYFLISFPILACLYFFILNYLESTGFDLAQFEGDLFTMIVVSFIQMRPSFIVLILIAISAILYGPLTAGMTYILRNFAREEHAWVWSDLFEKIKQNFKQGLIAGIIDILLIFTMILYLTMKPIDSPLGTSLTVFKYVFFVVFIIYQIMRYYIYTIMVTFDMKFIAILKNAWLFVILGIVKNVIITVFAGAVLYFTTSFLNFVFLPLFTFTFTGFIVVFNAYPVIKKYMIDPLSEHEEDSTIEIEYEDEDDAPVFEDDVTLRNQEKIQIEDKK